MRRQRALLVPGVLCLLAGALYSQRARIEREVVDLRRPAIQDEARALLRAALEHPDKFIRIDAAGHLAELGDPRGFRVLERALQDPNAIARWSALRELIPFEERALPLVEQGLTDDADYVRNAAVLVLGHMRCAPAQQRLWELWANPAAAKDTVVLGALLARAPLQVGEIVMAEVRQPTRLTPTEALTLWLACRRPLEQAVGLDTVATYDAALLPIVEAWAERVGGTDGSARRLARAYRRRVEDSADMARAFEAPPAGVREQLTALRAQRLTTRWPQAADADTLRRRLRDPDVGRRTAAATEASQVPTPAVIEVVDDVLRGETAERVRAPLLRFLVREAPARAVPHVIASLESYDTSSRSSTAETIRRFPHRELVPAYAYAIRNEYGYVRLAAVNALTKTRHPDRARLLARALHDEAGDVRVRAAAGLLASW